MRKVSIIIAAYNIENYIERCINSCSKQTFNDIEIIVVNDGSTDKTLEILNNLSKKDNRIKIINQKNKGLVEARKSGLREAEGEYILFLDGDDYIKQNNIEILYKNAIEEEYDVVCYKYFEEYDDGKIIFSWDKGFVSNKGNKLLDLLFEGKVSHSIWSKFIRRDFIKENNIELPTNFSFGEDLAFSYTLAMHNPKFKIIDEALYYYKIRKGSLDYSINKKTIEIVKALEFIKIQLQKNNIYENYKERFEYLAFMQAYYMRKNYIFNYKNEISKTLFIEWRKMGIKISSKNNNLYKKLYENDGRKAEIIDSICRKSYFLGCLYYRLRY